MSAEDAVRSREASIVKGVLGGAIGRMSALIAPFVVMPLMLNYLGDVGFGVWMTIVSVTSMALFMDFGISNGLLTRLSAALGRGDICASRGYIAGAYFVLCLIAFLIILAAIAWLSIVNLHSPPPGGGANGSDDGVARWVVASSVMCFAAGLPASVIQRILYADQKAWVVNAWLVAGSLLSVLLCLTGIWFRLPAGMVVLAYSSPPVLVMAIAAKVYFASRPELRPRVEDISEKWVRDLLGIGSKFLALSILTSVSLNVDSAVIAKFMGAEAVTAYSIPSKLASILGLVVSLVFLPLWAANGEAVARRDFVWVRNSTVKMTILGAAIVFLLSVCLFFSAEAITTIWVGRVFEDQELVIASASALSVLMAATSASQMLLNSVGEVRVQLWCWMAYGFISIPAKCLVATHGAVWMIPAVGAAAYLLVVVPIIFGRTLSVINAFRAAP